MNKFLMEYKWLPVIGFQALLAACEQTAKTNAKHDWFEPERSYNGFN